MDDEFYKTCLDVTPRPCIVCGTETKFRVMTDDGLHPCCPNACLGRTLGAT